MQSSHKGIHFLTAHLNGRSIHERWKPSTSPTYLPMFPFWYLTKKSFEFSFVGQHSQQDLAFCVNTNETWKHKLLQFNKPFELIFGTVFTFIQIHYIVLAPLDWMFNFCNWTISSRLFWNVFIFLKSQLFSQALLREEK